MSEGVSLKSVYSKQLIIGIIQWFCWVCACVRGRGGGIAFDTIQPKKRICEINDYS